MIKCDFMKPGMISAQEGINGYIFINYVRPTTEVNEIIEKECREYG